MTDGLTQRERMMLQDGLKHEEVCVWKYRSHAERVSNPAAKTMLNEIAQDEQNHYNTINRFLGGAPGGQPSFRVEAGMETQPVQGTLGQGRTGQAIGQRVMGGPQTGTVQKTSGTAEDALLLSDLLMIEKFVSGAYDTAIFEMRNPEIRQALQQIQKDEQKHGERIFNHMQQTGMYQTSQ